MQEFRHEQSGEIQQRVTVAPNREALFNKMERVRNELEADGFHETNRKKLGRNDFCPCGSGIKFKKCHISKVAQLNQILEEVNKGSSHHG
jgi:uncharacterized protein YecA (UPF0149 family)